jgi:MFS family permease
MMAVVAFGVFVAADDLMVVATMLRPMINDFDLIIPDDLNRAAWIVNVYLIAYIAVMPVAGRLSDVIGRRAVFVGALAVFLVGSLVIPQAESLSVLLAGRALTAIGGGALVPVAFAVAGDLYTGPDRVRAMGFLGAVETIGWIWGPLYGAILVRYLSWQWQFHLNVPLALAGMAVGWRVLAPGHRAERRIDWLGAGLLTVGLVALNVALLNEAKIQTVTGLEELTGSDGDGFTGPWLYAVAAGCLIGLLWHERRVAGHRGAGRQGSGPRGAEPIVSTMLIGHRTAAASLAVNTLVGVGIVVALINVPLIVNIVEGGIARSAVRSGWLLTALTMTMAATSYLGGVVGGRVGYRRPTLAGLSLAIIGLALMGLVWDPETSALTMALHLALVGSGIGLVLAPTSTAVIDLATDDDRGAAAGLVILARLIGFSVGLAALTAWGLRRYDALRADAKLPPITDPDYAQAVAEATVDVSTSALAETFLGAALVLAAALATALLVDDRRRHQEPRAEPPEWSK